MGGKSKVYDLDETYLDADGTPVSLRGAIEDTMYALDEPFGEPDIGTRSQYRALQRALKTGRITPAVRRILNDQHYWFNEGVA